MGITGTTHCVLGPKRILSNTAFFSLPLKKNLGSWDALTISFPLTEFPMTFHERICMVMFWHYHYSQSTLRVTGSFEI